MHSSALYAFRHQHGLSASFLSNSGTRLSRIQHFAFVDPYLYADTAIGRMSLLQTHSRYPRAWSAAGCCLHDSCSLRAISAPPKRPPHSDLDALGASLHRCVPMHCFIARRKEIRRSSCCATFSATSCASISSTLHFDDVDVAGSAGNLRSSSFFSASTPAPPRPMTTPGLAV